MPNAGMPSQPGAKGEAPLTRNWGSSGGGELLSPPPPPPHPASSSAQTIIAAKPVARPAKQFRAADKGGSDMNIRGSERRPPEPLSPSRIKSEDHYSSTRFTVLALTRKGVTPSFP